MLRDGREGREEGVGDRRRGGTRGGEGGGRVSQEWAGRKGRGKLED